MGFSICQFYGLAQKKYILGTLRKLPNKHLSYDEKEPGLMSLIICISQRSTRKKATLHSKGFWNLHSLGSLLSALWKAGDCVWSCAELGREDGMKWQGPGAKKPVKMSWNPCCPSPHVSPVMKVTFRRCWCPSPWSWNIRDPGLERNWRRISGRNWMTCKPSCCPSPTSEPGDQRQCVWVASIPSPTLTFRI